jgi:O-antigen ligase
VLKFRHIWVSLAFLVVLATTLMTRSRAGALLTLAALGLVTVLYFGREIKTGRRRLTGLTAAAGIGLLFVAIAGGQLEHRIETQGVFDAGRWDTWASSLSIIKAHPWLGTGLGTFAGVFPAYRSPAGGVWGVWDHAHSTPIELMVEMGIPFSLLVFVSWLLMLATLVRASWWRRGDNRIYIIAGAGIGFLATLHSLVDFPLQIPGFSIVCGVLLGASLAAALATTTESAIEGALVCPDADKVETEARSLVAAIDCQIPSEPPKRA